MNNKNQHSVKNKQSAKAEQGYAMTLIVQRPFIQHTVHEFAKTGRLTGQMMPFSVTGHATVALTDASGKTEYYGLFPKSLLKSAAFPAVRGEVRKDKPRFIDDSITYPVTSEQYNRARSFLEKGIEKPPIYSGVCHNCVDYAYKAMKAADIRPPNKMALSLPRSVSNSIRKAEGAYLFATRELTKAAKDIGKSFSSDKLVVRSAKTAKKKSSADWSAHKDGLPMTLASRLKSTAKLRS